MTTVHRPGRLTPGRRRAIDALLDRLLDLDTPDRDRRMREIARRHPRIHAHLERLVEASEQPTTFLKSALDRVGDAALSEIGPGHEALPPGTRIGDWRLIEPIGTGGMGVVYRAERADGAFEMTAAVKFIRSPDDPLMAQRLALETRLLAQLDHPNIARVLDGGTLPDGQNYLVMEWIEGEDLTECREKAGSVHERCLRLFIDIAEAVAHAHQRQIVHGDIKPANIRITEDGRPRLLDFGVARLISAEPGDDSRTPGLTPAFSAPEQLTGSPASTQSDVYALGSLLRWMLTGDPSRPDAPVSRTELPAPRPAALAALINKATDNDPERRYRSVPEMISDVEALLDTRPVSAIRYGTLSRIGLWARRHRMAATLSTIALTAVVAGVAGVSWQARIAAAERDAARFEAERSTLLREQLVLLFREVGQHSGDRELSTRELLEESVRVAEQLHASDPQMLISIKALLGEIHIAMNDFAGAQPLLEAFVDYKPNFASPLMQAIVRADLAQIQVRQGESERALALTESALQTLRQRSGDNARRIADVMQTRGQALRGLGRWDESIAVLRQAKRLARQQPAPSRLRATTANNLATTLIYAGRADEALGHLREALDNWRRLGLENGTNALTVMANLAGLLHKRGDLSEAEPLYREAIRVRTERFGESGALAAAHLNLGSLLALRNRRAEARDHIARGMAMIQRFEGSDSVNYIRAVMARGRAELSTGNPARALDDLEDARQRFASAVGPDHLFTTIAAYYAAAAEARIAGRATERLAEVVAKMESMQPASTEYLAHAKCEQARLMIETDPDAAIERARRCIEMRRDELSLSRWRVAEARAIMLAARIAAGDRDAISGLREARATLARALGENHPKLAWCDRWLNA